MSIKTFGDYKCKVTDNKEMESWIPLMYEFYSMDESFKRDYPAFSKKCKEDLDRKFN